MLWQEEVNKREMKKIIEAAKQKAVAVVAVVGQRGASNQTVQCFKTDKWDPDLNAAPQ